MDKKDETISLITEALRELWEPVPEAKLPQVMAFLEERDCNSFLHSMSKDNWLEVISSQTSEDLREYIRSEEEAINRIKQLETRKPTMTGGGKRGIGRGLGAFYSPLEKDSTDE